MTTASWGKRQWSHETRMDQFWRRVEKTEACWLWRGGTNGSGYGRVQWDGRSTGAHRVSYEALVGPIPEGLTIDHLCRVRNCVNPQHLEPVTLEENIRRANALKVRTSHCRKGHERTPENTRHTVTGHVECRVCTREAKRRRLCAEELRAEIELETEVGQARVPDSAREAS